MFLFLFLALNQFLSRCQFSSHLVGIQESCWMTNYKRALGRVGDEAMECVVSVAQVVLPIDHVMEARHGVQMWWRSQHGSCRLFCCSNICKEWFMCVIVLLGRWCLQNSLLRIYRMTPFFCWRKNYDAEKMLWSVVKMSFTWTCYSLNCQLSLFISSIEKCMFCSQKPSNVYLMWGRTSSDLGVCLGLGIDG